MTDEQTSTTDSTPAKAKPQGKKRGRRPTTRKSRRGSTPSAGLAESSEPGADSAPSQPEHSSGDSVGSQPSDTGSGSDRRLPADAGFMDAAELEARREIRVRTQEQARKMLAGTPQDGDRYFSCRVTGCDVRKSRYDDPDVAWDPDSGQWHCSMDHLAFARQMRGAA